MTLEIEEWEIWHTYSTYLDSGPFDLEKGARSLLESGVAFSAMESNGRTYWKMPQGVASGTTTIDSRDISFTLTPNSPSSSGRLRTGNLGGKAYFMIGERRVLGDSPALSDPYVRAYLGKCVVTKTFDDSSISHLNLYSVLIVYESGVLILEFHMIGPNKPVGIERFIDGGVNLFQESFSQVEVNLVLARNATTAYYRS